MRIDAILIESLPPFRSQVIEFPNPVRRDIGEVHLVTGGNGSGKTRLLSVLAAALGNPQNLLQRLSNPVTERVQAVASDQEFVRIWDLDDEGVKVYKINHSIPWRQLSSYKDSFRRDKREMATRAASIGRTLPLSSSQGPLGAFAFTGTSKIDDSKIEAMKRVELGKVEDHLDFEYKNNSAVLCQSMANLKMAAAMEQLRRLKNGPVRAIEIVQRLEDAVSKIAGRTFAFDVIAHPETRIRAHWGGHDMRFNQLPDGLRSILGWLVACVAKLDSLYPDHPAPLDIPLILLIDEPESHLHIAWQRLIIPTAQELFPNSQIFVATHSPFVISSVNAGWIHKLKMQEDGSVVNESVPCPEGDSYIDVVEDVLGLSQWFDPETERLLTEFRELRENAKTTRDIKPVAEKGEEIAARGIGLKEIVVREMKQLYRQLQQ
ncbi:MAG: AAA family ATPase [Planctomycetaceae bacterium]|nr:AAA family ATPase [Planctomycetaceae bacterium]